ncbi:MAG: GNAT family N-acetyltransferase [Saprospiraceae bacterium]
MKILPYTDQHFEATIQVFQANVPEHFAQEEITMLKEYLVDGKEDYFVVLDKGILVAAGGINYTKDGTGGVLSWAAVAPNFQRKGYGTALVNHRVEFIKNQNNFDKIICRTSQTAFEFYQKMGFTLQYTKKDFWAPGLDLYYMEMHLE